MLQPVAQRLKDCIDSEFPMLQQISGTTASAKTGKAWSRKEELGHLVDSASNNHLRFVGAILEPRFQGKPYDQDGSVVVHGYQDSSWTNLVEFWRSYNLLLVQLVNGIPEAKLTTPCTVGSNAPVTLQFLIEDYILHMQHHLDHILRRDAVTPYPRPTAILA